MGQAADGGVEMLGRGGGMSVYLTRHGIDLQIPAASVGAPARESASDAAPRVGAPVRLRMTLAGDSDLDWTGLEKLSGVTNYLIGNDRSRWHTDVPHFANAETRPQKNQGGNPVGVRIYDNGENLEYDLRLAPGADAGKVRLRIAGAEEKRLASNGDLLLTLGRTVVTLGRPAIFEDSPGASSNKRRQVGGGFALEADGSVGIRVGAHDSHAGLLIDPSISVGYATFLGGSGGGHRRKRRPRFLREGLHRRDNNVGVQLFGGPSKSIGAVDGATELFIAKIDPSIAGANSLVYTLRFWEVPGRRSGRPDRAGWVERCRHYRDDYGR